jgi:Clp amino terminal domain, pathogenicity island component
MFERFTDRARRVVVLAQEEARMLNHNYIGTEHILLGLIHEGEGVAAKALESLGISLEAVRQQVEEIIGQGQQAPSGHIPFTPRAKKVLELSLREALQLGHNYIGTEHILLGLIREGEGVAAQVLVRLGADLNRVREQVIQLLHGYPSATKAARAAAAPAPPSSLEQQVARLVSRMKGIESRLSAIELRLGDGPDLTRLDDRIADTAAEKRSAVVAERYEQAAALRDTERQLQAERDVLMSDWARTQPSLSALAEEVVRLSDEVARLGATETGAAQDEALEEFDEEPGPPLDSSSEESSSEDEAAGDSSADEAPGEGGAA